MNEKIVRHIHPSFPPGFLPGKRFACRCGFPSLGLGLYETVEVLDDEGVVVRQAHRFYPLDSAEARAAIDRAREEDAPPRSAQVP